MKKWTALAITLLLVGCGGTQTREGDGPATMDDFDNVEVYEGPEGDTRTGTRNNRTTPREPIVKDDPAPDTAAPRDKPVREPEPEAKEPAPEVKQPGDEPAKEPGPEVKQPGDEPKTEPDAGNEHEKLADEFIRAVNLKVFELEESKAWQAYLDAIDKFNKRFDKAKDKRNKDNGKGKDKGKDLEQAWADTIEAWYDARYFQALFLHLYAPADDYTPVFVHDRDEVLTLSADELKSENCRLTQAANELVGGKSKELMQFQTDVLKYDRKASDVYADEKWQKRWKDEKKKWQDAANGKIDNKDLKKYRG